MPTETRSGADNAVIGPIEEPSTVSHRLIRYVGPIFGLVLFVIALWILHREMSQFHFRETREWLRALPHGRLLAALALTVLNYTVLTFYDFFAVRYVRHSIAYPRIVLASFISYAFAHNTGMAALSGGSVRYRIYSGWGFTAFEVTKIALFCTLTFWLGFLLIAGLVFTISPVAIPASLRLPVGSLGPIGIGCLVLLSAYILISLVWRRPVRIRTFEIEFPRFPLSIVQVAVAALDWSLAAGALYALLSPTANIGYPAFLGLFLFAQTAGLLSQVPGGLGVFESAMILFLAPRLPGASVLGSLIAFRGIYYLLPLLAATVLLGAHEARQRGEDVRRVGRWVGQWVPAVVPNVLAFTTFVGGAILLFSGATPAVWGRMAWLHKFLPLPVLELSHFLGSLAGVGLMILARGLQRRIDAAYMLACVLLAAGAVLSLLKGFEYEQALILTLMLAGLLPCHAYFYRRSSLFTRRFSSGWAIAVIVVLGCALWFGFFSLKNTAYSSDLWWRFTVNGNAPRFLRAMAGTVGLLLFYAAAQLLRPGSPKVHAPSADEIEKVRAIVTQSERIYAWMALVGDKRFLLNDRGNAFIMYGIEGHSWVALGDPVGPKEEHAELAWRYREMCDQYGGWTVFYYISPQALPLCIDLGLSLLKIGEEGRVPLAEFALAGNARKGLRQAHSRVVREGGSFEIVPREQVGALLPELRVISDAWLADKNTREKRFSIGRFDPEYLRQFPLALVRRDGRVIAFANVLLGAPQGEISVDLMRHLPDAPSSVMEYLFIETMLYGKAQGYAWFNIGIVPLSGLEDHDLAPIWTRLGALVFRHGEHFYNFQGLRAYKEKFDPVWEPRYFASPGGLALPRIITDVAALTSGGYKGMMAR